MRLDCQGWLLPASFRAQVLTNIQVKSFGNNPNGVPTVTAITVQTNGPALALAVAAGPCRHGQGFRAEPGDALGARKRAMGWEPYLPPHRIENPIPQR